MKRILVVLATAVAIALGIVTAAAAVTAPMGNSAVDRQSVDSWTDFVIVDTNHSAPYDGYFTSINYYAERAGTIRFVVVDDNDAVTWVSDAVAAAAGPGVLNLGEPVGLTAGSNLGVYSAGAGVISFDYDAAAEPANFTLYNTGLPAVGQELDYVGDSGRVYSMNADVTASSPEVCKNDGWMSYGYPNQGQCIASVVANAHAGK